MSDARPPRVRSVRHRLLAIALLPTLVILPLLLGATMLRWSAKFDDLLITKVNSDLTVARQYLARILETTGERVEALGQSAEFASARDPRGLLEDRRAAMGLDFLYVADAAGRLLAASPAGAAPVPQGRLVEGALQGQARTAIDILPAAELATISPDLAARARLPLVPTPNAVPTDRAVEDRGMVVRSAVPVALPDGGRGLLVGGLLLNQNLVFIDTINDLVYRQGSLPEGSQGTATLFLDDVRISTNVRLFEGRRALGTRVSAAVRDKVLGQGETGSTAPSSSTTGTFRPMSRSPTAPGRRWGCSMSVFWRRRFPPPSGRRCGWAGWGFCWSRRFRCRSSFAGPGGSFARWNV